MRKCSVSNIEKFTQTVLNQKKHFFLTVGQNNFQNKIPLVKYFFQINRSLENYIPSLLIFNLKRKLFLKRHVISYVPQFRGFQTIDYRPHGISCRGSLWFEFLIFIYRMRAINPHGLYIFNPLFEGQKRFLRGFFFVKLWPYVWLVFKSGLWWRAYGNCNGKTIGKTKV